jgi:hypothetical protein
VKHVARGSSPPAWADLRLGACDEAGGGAHRRGRELAAAVAADLGLGEMGKGIEGEVVDQRGKEMSG